MSTAEPARPTVFALTHEFFPKRGGIATFVEEIARAGAAQGHTIEVWAQAAPSGTDQTQAWPFRVRRLSLRGTHGWACQWAMAREMVIHRRLLRHATVWLPEPGPMLALMQLQGFRAFRPRHLLLTFHGSDILRLHRRPVTRLLLRRLLGHATGVSTLTHFTQNLLCERFPEAKGKCFLTPGALRAGFAPASGGAARKTAKGKLVVLTVGRLHPRKGQLVTLRALQALPLAQRSGIEYWIVGSASRSAYARQLQTAAASAGFPVKFLGNLPDPELDAVYGQADLFALTSIDHGQSVEGFGLVYLEALAHGLPVVAHRVGGVAEAVADGVTGLLVPPDQPARLTATFARLLADAGWRHRLGEAGRPWATRNTWARSADLLFGPGPSSLAYP